MCVWGGGGAEVGGNMQGMGKLDLKGAFSSGSAC